MSFCYEIRPAGIDLDAMRFQGLDAILDWLAGTWPRSHVISIVLRSRSFFFFFFFFFRNFPQGM